MAGPSPVDAKLLRGPPDATGDRLTLQELVDSTREDGRISKTDWSTVDGLGALIARDIEAFRAYILSEVADLEAKPLIRTRSSELNELTDDLLKESLALLVVVENNYMLWQEARIAHVASHEDEALAVTIADARSKLDSIAKADQGLVDTLLEAARALLESTGYEGFLPREKARLRANGDQINELVDWFSAQRNLDSEASHDRGRVWLLLGAPVYEPERYRGAPAKPILGATAVARRLAKRLK